MLRNIAPRGGLDRTSAVFGITPPIVDLMGYDARCGVLADKRPSGLNLRWPTDGGEWGRLSLNLEKGAPLIRVVRTAA